jgi:hypothetical protein
VFAFHPTASVSPPAGADNAIRVWDVGSGKQELVIEQHADWILGLAFDSSGTMLASASRDKTARVFDAKTGEGESSYQSHGDAVLDVAWRNTNTLCSVGRDRKIHVWSVKDAKKIAEFSGWDADAPRLLVADESILRRASTETCANTRSRRKNCCAPSAAIAMWFTRSRATAQRAAHHGQLRWRSANVEPQNRRVAAEVFCSARTAWRLRKFSLRRSEHDRAFAQERAARSQPAARFTRKMKQARKASAQVRSSRTIRSDAERGRGQGGALSSKTRKWKSASLQRCEGTCYCGSTKTARNEIIEPAAQKLLPHCFFVARENCEQGRSSKTASGKKGIQ